MSSDTLTVGALAAALDRRFPCSTAETWDRVGLIVGSPDSALTGVLTTLDATAEAVARAVELGASVVLSHHPPFLDMPDHITVGTGPAGTLEAALRLGVSVISMHTNLDRAPDGATALPALLGLTCDAPLEEGTEEVAVIVVYAPGSAERALREAMAAAGAGSIGSYDGCAFVGVGVGHFTPHPGATPAVDASANGVDEVRIEMVAQRSAASRVLEAAREAHPYEEPVLLAIDAVRARAAARLGRLCRWTAGGTVGALAAHVGSALGVSPRVWGDPQRSVGTIAVANGSAGSLVRRAAQTADTLIAGEVRYHDALDAVASGLSVIEAGHDATEWPLVGVLTAAAREIAPHVTVTQDAPGPGWWTMEVADDRR